MLGWMMTATDLNLATWWGVMVLAFCTLPLLPLAVAGCALVRDLAAEPVPTHAASALCEGFHARDAAHAQGLPR